MANLTGIKMKFTVLKNEDVDFADSQFPQLNLLRGIERVSEKVQQLRSLEGKQQNTYLVINTDEPYADEVIDILKRHGHWG